jgi:putative hydrolase of the HAD superfamily
MHSSIDTILFDIGGTLRLTERHQQPRLENIEEIIRLTGISGSAEDLVPFLKEHDQAYYRWASLTLLELTEAELWSKWLLPEADPDRVKPVAAQLNKLWRDAKSTKYPLADTAVTLRELSRRGYRLGVISNTTSTTEVPAMLAEQHLTDLMETVILSTIQGHRKPHPSLFIEATRNLGISPSQAVYVGDRPSRDVVGAREAGIAEVIIIQLDGKAPENDQTHQKPDHIIRELPELLDLFPARQPTETQSPGFSSPPLYDCSISTMWGINRHANFNDFFIEARQLGFARFELNHQVKPDMLAEIDFNPFHIFSLHEPCPAVMPLPEMDRNDWMISSLDEDKRAIAVNSAKQTIDMAVRLGCRYVVIHPGATGIDRAMEKRFRELFDTRQQGTPEFNKIREDLISARNKVIEAHLAATITSLKEIGPYAFKAGVAIALENRYHYYDIPLLDEMQILLDLFDDTGWGFNYDVGHAQALDRLGFFKHEDWLIRYADRMIAIHLHDVVGITDHQIPGTGEIDFKWLASRLPSAAQRTLEVSPNNRIEDIRKGMEHLVLTGCVIQI